LNITWFVQDNRPTFCNDLRYTALLDSSTFNNKTANMNVKNLPV